MPRTPALANSAFSRTAAVYGPTVHRAIMMAAQLGQFATRSTTPVYLTIVPREPLLGMMETVERVCSGHHTYSIEPADSS